MFIKTKKLIAVLQEQMPMLTRQQCIEWLVAGIGDKKHRARKIQQFGCGETIAVLQSTADNVSNMLKTLSERTGKEIDIKSILFTNNPTGMPKRKNTAQGGEMLTAQKEMLSVLIDIKTQLYLLNGKIDKLCAAWETKT